MNKDEFIMKIIARHSPNMTPNQIPLATEDYTASLEENIDFDLLFDTYLNEYNFNTPPKPAWLKQRAKRRIQAQAANYEIRDLLVVLPDGNQYQFAYEYPRETEQQAIEEIVRRFMKKEYKLYRIVKKYDYEKDNNGIEKGWLRYKEEIILWGQNATLYKS